MEAPSPGPSLRIRGDELGGFDPAEAFELIAAEDAFELDGHRFLELVGVADRADDLNDVHREQRRGAGRAAARSGHYRSGARPDGGRHFGARFGIAGVGEYLTTAERRCGGQEAGDGQEGA